MVKQFHYLFQHQLPLVIYNKSGHTRSRVGFVLSITFRQFSSAILVQGHDNATSGITCGTGEHSDWITQGFCVNYMKK